MASTLIWSAVLMVAALWPSRALTLAGGAPLDGRAAAVLIGLAVPALCWMHGRYLAGTLARVAIIALLLVKIAGAVLLTQQGLCAKFSTAAPYATTVLTIPIEEPRGALRSWDVRAGWRDEAPRCTAIVDRSYDAASSFPAWFVNVTDFAGTGPRHIAMDVDGYVTAPSRGVFVVDVDRDMTVAGSIGAVQVASTMGRPMLAALDEGVNRIDLHATLTGDRWRFVPTWNGADGFGALRFTTAAPRALDRLAPAAGFLETALVVLIVAGWVVSIAFEYSASPALLAWMAAASLVLAAVGMSGRFERLGILLLAVAIAVPVAESHRNLRGALLLIGVPWLTLIAVRSLPQVGRFTAYSIDDWLAYQVAGYRIYMHGYWLEGGTKLFDYQPLYRWITGALHLAFGDSSVGETYWDAICLLLGASAAFAVVDRVAGFRWALAAAVGTLATYWLGTIWYFIGRGLSEVSAAGWGFAAALLLLKLREHAVRGAVIAGVFAVLMFYTRLNHLFFAVFLLALATPFAIRPAIAYLTTFGAGVVLFAARTWWYTGHFSLLYGTSLKNNDTGLRLTTVLSSDVWRKIWHSLRALVWMNEPPSFDPRALLVVAGVLLSIGAVALAGKVNRMSLAVAVVTIGACVSSFFAHTHNYPGRMSIHLAPFAVAMTMMAGARLAR